MAFVLSPEDKFVPSVVTRDVTRINYYRIDLASKEWWRTMMASEDSSGALTTVPSTMTPSFMVPQIVCCVFVCVCACARLFVRESQPQRPVIYIRHT